MRRRLGAFLHSPRATWIIPLLGCLLVASSLTNGLNLDDLLHSYKAQGGYTEDLKERLDLFSFLPRDEAGKQYFRDLGYIPWFADPELELAFFRPISSALAFFDYNVLAFAPWLMHLESVAVYGLLVWLVVLFYRRFSPGPIAVLAGLLYAIDETHGYPVGWLANRNAVLATVFGVLALLAHDRWRRDGWRAGAWLGPAAFVVALLSAEFGLGALGYVVAYGLCIDRATSWARRLLPVVPYLLILVVWQVIYRSMGFGTHASGWYVDPVADLGHFLSLVPERTVVLLASAYTFFPADAYGFAPRDVARVIAIAALGVVALVAWVVVPVVRRDPVLRFYAVGSALALPPVLSALPADRLLFFVGIGVFGVVARFLAHLLDREERATVTRPRRERVLGGVFVATHLAIAPLLMPLAAASPGILHRLGEAGTTGLSQLPLAPDRLLVLVNMPNPLSGMPFIFGPEPLTARRARILATAQYPVKVTREDERTVTLVLDERENLSAMLTLFRRETDLIRAGDTFDVPGLHAEVTAARPDGTPRSARFRFQVRLEDLSLQWVAWNGKELVPFAPPAVGTSVTVGVHQ